MNKKNEQYSQWEKFWNNKPFAITFILVLVSLLAIIIFKPFS